MLYRVHFLHARPRRSGAAFCDPIEESVMPKVVASIESFLTAKLAAHNGQDLLQRFLTDIDRLETQVNVAAGKGWRVEGKTNTYTDGLDEWWNIRIPKNANSNPEFRNYNLPFVLDEHAESIGCTGWDYVNRKSLWVGFDFDSITGHAKGVGVSDTELQRVREAACALPYVQVRKSTGGKGLHLYVYFDLDKIVTENHTVHAALGRAILGLMSSETGFDFASHIDACGGNMWIWHRKANAENGGFALIKDTDKILTDADIPANWKDNVEVVTRQRAKIKVTGVDAPDIDPFEALASARRIVPLDAKHKAIHEALKTSGFSTVWVPDHHLLQTHTCALKKLMDEQKGKMGLKGFFQTISEGKNPGEPNCFLFPIDEGAWKVYLFGPGRPEAVTWEQDGQGWTTCYFNKPPGLKVASRAYGGIEDSEQGGFLFENAKEAVKAAEALGQKINLPAKMMDRSARVKAHKDGRLVVHVAKKNDDSGMEGWAGKKDNWTRVFDAKADQKSAEVDFQEYDNILRSLVTSEGGDAGWVYKNPEGGWDRLQTDKVKLLLLHLGNSKSEAELILGHSLARRWKLVNIPFQPEYPGNRQWNFEAAQFRYTPLERNDDVPVQHPHWDIILKHCGQDLTEPLLNLEWARHANIKTGADYLLAWAASMFRNPFVPLPYLFFYSPKQNNGKSIFHEALALLMTKGVASADRALTNPNDFNGELANAVLAYVEEKDVSKAQGAYNKIKEWVTSPLLWIHRKRMDIYSQPNTLHFVHTANDREACPVFPGDERITMFFVPDLKPGQEIAKPILLERLRAEAPAFMRTLMDLQLPPLTGRLGLPVVSTFNKQAAEENNKTPLELFIQTNCFDCPQARTDAKTFMTRFVEYLDSEDRERWASLQKVKKAMPDKYPFATGNGNVRQIGNLSFEDDPSSKTKPRLIARNQRFVVANETEE